MTAHVAGGRLPDFVIVGAPKAGTTSLARWLGEHPGAFIAPEKEVRYFNLHHDRGQDWYRSRFAEARPGQLAGEATPGYLYDDAALQRIQAEVPDATLLVLLRDPVARAWSQYQFFRAMGVEHESWDVLVQEPDRGSFDHVGHSRYLPRLEVLGRICGRDRVRVLFTEELRVDPVGTLAALAADLGLDPAQNPPMADRNVGRTPRLPPALHAPSMRIAGRLPAGATGAARRLLTRPGSVTMPARERRRLALTFREHNAALADWLGRPLPAAWAS